MLEHATTCHLPHQKLVLLPTEVWNSPLQGICLDTYTRGQLNDKFHLWLEWFLKDEGASLWGSGAVALYRYWQWSREAGFFRGVRPLWGQREASGWTEQAKRWTSIRFLLTIQGKLVFGPECLRISALLSTQPVSCWGPIFCFPVPDAPGKTEVDSVCSLPGGLLQHQLHLWVVLFSSKMLPPVFFFFPSHFQPSEKDIHSKELTANEVLIWGKREATLS